MQLLQLLEKQKPLIMGILNVTPDSFSDGGENIELDRAVHHALMMVEEGADIIDIGGESTRPGSPRVTAKEQIRRVEKVILKLRKSLPKHIPISIDTMLAEVASSALCAGAEIINDVSAGTMDQEMFLVAAKWDCPLILMHMQGNPETMQNNPNYSDVVSEIATHLIERITTAQQAGVSKRQICIDIGIGFGKTRDHNLRLLANLHHFSNLGYPVLLGTSRKRFMGAICAETEPRNLVYATCATTTLGVMAGIRIFRVHDVKANRQAADVTWAILNAGH